MIMKILLVTIGRLNDGLNPAVIATKTMIEKVKKNIKEQLVGHNDIIPLFITPEIDIKIIDLGNDKSKTPNYYLPIGTGVIPYSQDLTYGFNSPVEISKTSDTFIAFT